MSKHHIEFELYTYELLHSRRLLDWVVRPMTRAEKKQFSECNAICLYGRKEILYCPYRSPKWCDDEQRRIAAHETAHAIGYRGHALDHSFMTWKLKRQLR